MKLLLSPKMDKKLTSNQVRNGYNFGFRFIVIQFTYPDSDDYYVKWYSLNQKKHVDEAYNFVKNHRDYDDIQGYTMCKTVKKKNSYIEKFGGLYKEPVPSENHDMSDDFGFSESEDDDIIGSDVNGSDFVGSDDESDVDSSMLNKSECEGSDVEENDSLKAIKNKSKVSKRSKQHFTEEDSECESESKNEMPTRKLRASRAMKKVNALVESGTESESETSPRKSEKRSVLHGRKEIKKRANHEVQSESESGSESESEMEIEKASPPKSEKCKVLRGKKEIKNSKKARVLDAKKRANHKVQSESGSGSESESESEMDMEIEKEPPLKSEKRNVLYGTKNTKKPRLSVSKKQGNTEAQCESESDTNIGTEKPSAVKSDRGVNGSKKKGRSETQKSVSSGSMNKGNEDGEQKKKQTAMELNSAYDKDDDEEGVDLSALAGE